VCVCECVYVCVCTGVCVCELCVGVCVRVCAHGCVRHQEITRVILCRLIFNDIIIHMKFSNDIIMFSKIV